MFHFSLSFTHLSAFHTKVTLPGCRVSLHFYLFICMLAFWFAFCCLYPCCSSFVVVRFATLCCHLQCTVVTGHLLSSFAIHNLYFIFKGGFFVIISLMYVIQHCFICLPSDSTVSEDAGIKPRTSHWQPDDLTTRLDLISSSVIIFFCLKYFAFLCILSLFDNLL
jgi:hypothetical protein